MLKPELKKFNIFGSHDSTDIDVLFSVTHIPPKGELTDLMSTEAREIISKYHWANGKEIDPNFCVIGDDGRVSASFKGTVDEVNNMLMATYGVHPSKQEYPCFVHVRHERDLYKKSARVLRGLLLHISRTQYRSIVKPALRGTARDKIAALRSINLSSITDLGNKNDSLTEYYKFFATQIGQATALIRDNIEIFTKTLLAVHYPELAPYLRREPIDIESLDVIKNNFLSLLEKHLQLDKINE